MEITATFCSYDLQFLQASGTSRGIITNKTSYFIKIKSHGQYGYGECGLLKGLSFDDVPDYEAKLQWACENISLGIHQLWEMLRAYPSIQFGLEQAFLSLESNPPFELFPTPFTQGANTIPINGLVWMGSEDFMKNQIDAVIDKGFTCVKMKIGAIEWAQELNLLKSLRKRYNRSSLEIRVDANGAFTFNQAQKVIKELAAIDVHSIEQPLAAKNTEELAQLCSKPLIPIALDESLIPCIRDEQKQALLDQVKPQYIILKPSFVGGFKGSDYWISLAETRGIGWWATSALESNVGLNAISQWVFNKKNDMPQGLGTGSLYSNNIPSPLYVKNGAVGYDQKQLWNLKNIDELCM